MNQNFNAFLAMLKKQTLKIGYYIQSLISSLRCIPEAIESVSISVILFNSEPEEVVQLTELESIVLPIEFKNSMGVGILNTGKAIDFFIIIIMTKIYTIILIYEVYCYSCLIINHYWS